MDTDTKCSSAAMSVSMSLATGKRITHPQRTRSLCAQGLHDWDDWYALTSSPEIEYRYCGSCSVSEERPVAPDHRTYLANGTVNAPTRTTAGPHNPNIPDLGDPR